MWQEEAVTVDIGDEVVDVNWGVGQDTARAEGFGGWLTGRSAGRRGEGGERGEEPGCGGSARSSWADGRRSSGRGGV